MNDSKYWATYLRSVYNDRLADIKMKLILNSKTDMVNNYDAYEKCRIDRDGTNAVLLNEIFLNEKITAARSGIISTPWEFAEYQRIFKKKNPKKSRNKTKIDYNFYLYDELLKYKLKMCHILVENFEKSVKSQNIDVYCENDYPCVLVLVKKFKKLYGANIDINCKLVKKKNW